MKKVFNLLALVLALFVFSICFAQSSKVNDSAFVGTWILPNDNPEQGDTLMTLHADGTVLSASVQNGGNTPMLGVWEATGERSANITMSFLLGDNESFLFIGTATMRGTMTLDADGVLHGEATLMPVDAPGHDKFAGAEPIPVTVIGHRMAIEASPEVAP